MKRPILTENQLSLDLLGTHDKELSLLELANIRKSISLRWKGMANRANYQDFNECVGIALRKTTMSENDKREFAIEVADRLHGRDRYVCRDMTVDHICRIAGVSFKRIEEKLHNGDRYPYRQYS